MVAIAEYAENLCGFRVPPAEYRKYHAPQPQNSQSSDITVLIVAKVNPGHQCFSNICYLDHQQHTAGEHSPGPSGTVLGGKHPRSGAAPRG